MKKKSLSMLETLTNWAAWFFVKQRYASMARDGSGNVVDEEGIIHSKQPYEPYIQKVQGSAHKMLQSKVDQNLKQHGDWVCFEDCITGQSLKASEFISWSKTMSICLQNLGIGKGDRVHLCVYNSVYYPAILHAIWRLGAVASLGDPGCGRSYIQHQVKELQPKLIICSQSTYEKCKDQGCQLAFLGPKGSPDSCVDVLEEAGKQDEKTAPEPVTVEDPSQEMFAVLWTSGTTGFPKGVVYSHQVVWNMLTHPLTVKRKFGKQFIGTLFFHVGGFFNTFYSLYLHGFTTVMVIGSTG